MKTRVQKGRYHTVLVSCIILSKENQGKKEVFGELARRELLVSINKHNIFPKIGESVSFYDPSEDSIEVLTILNIFHYPKMHSICYCLGELEYINEDAMEFLE